MAQLVTYKCGSCNYAELVSGKRDWVFRGPTMTVSCAACRSLSDLLIGFNDKVQPRCPNCRSRRVKEWTGPGPCPRCPGLMQIDPDGEQVLAD